MHTMTFAFHTGGTPSGDTCSGAVQASLARAEMAAQEAGQLGRLRADIATSLQKKAQRLRTTTTRLASLLGTRIEHSMHKQVASENAHALSSDRLI